jgi:hypothetical protein
MTPSEEYVFILCQHAFLPLWALANPIGKDKRKELCDALVVFDNHIIIISVKYIEYKETKDVKIGWERWNKAAIKESIKQLRGAIRYIKNADEIKSKDDRVVFKLPERTKRKYHLITVSLGSKGEVPINIPQYRENIIHLLDDKSLEIIFGELDTVSDFIEYLEKKEELLKGERSIIGAEEDLFAYYLWNNRSFPENYSLMVFEDDMWESVSKNETYLGKKELDRISYFWDSVIREFIEKRDPEVSKILGYFDRSNENTELALRIMAKECRFSRRVLCQSFFDFHKDSSITSRVVKSQNSIVYIFLKKPTGYDREARQIELLARCMIIRNTIQEDMQIIGIATEDDISVGHSFDLVYFKKEQWTDDDVQCALSAKKDLGLFLNPRYIEVHADEFPVK